MSGRTLKALLSLSAVLLFFGAPLVIAWAVWAPCGVSESPTQSLQRKAPLPEVDPTPHVASQPNLVQFEALSQLLLRRPLYDPPPPKSPVALPPKPKAPPPIQLVGTIIEPGHSIAIVQTTAGELELMAIGDVVGPEGAQAQVERVDAELLVLRQDQELISIPMKAPNTRGR